MAADVWSIIHFGMLLGRVNVAEYNRSVAEDLDAEEIAAADLGEARREALLARSRRGKKLGAMCASIMTVTTIVGLAPPFAPALGAPDLSSFEPEGTTAMWFWAARPAGALVCGVVTLLWEALGSEA